jgi:hypothetical protein
MIRGEENIIYFLSTWPLSEGEKQQRNKEETKLITQLFQTPNPQ